MGADELKRQRHPVSEFPPGHGFVYPALQKSEPTFLMVLNDSECSSLPTHGLTTETPLGEVFKGETSLTLPVIF